MTAPRRSKPLLILFAKETYLAVLVFVFFNTTMYLSSITIDPPGHEGVVLGELSTFQRHGDSSSGDKNLRPKMRSVRAMPNLSIASRKGTLLHSHRVSKVSARVTTEMPASLENVLRDPLLLPSDRGEKLNLTLIPSYLGVLLDAGRHYFPVEWIYHLIDYLHLIGFNFLHFRLTDDQAFSIRLDSRPEFARPAPGSGGKVYTPNELREIVKYATLKGITIMPEVNVPGHAGAFAGVIPNLVVPCVGFICNAGYGLALNVTHPELMPLLKDVLGEVNDIFSSPPFFHLGGDELEHARPCFKELGIRMLNYSQFEVDLGHLLNDLGIPRKGVVRWEMTGQGKIQDTRTRVKGVDHYWISRQYQEEENPGPRFCSEGLYFDTNDDDASYTIFNKTRSMLEHRHKPTAIIAGTFELGLTSGCIAMSSGGYWQLLWAHRGIPTRM